MTALKFEDQDLPDLDEYAARAEQFIPGRLAIFSIVEAAFLELLTDGPARILVVGAGGAMIKSIGVAARRALTTVLGRPVHLQLWCKVRDNWSDDEAALRRFGYGD